MKIMQLLSMVRILGLCVFFVSIAPPIVTHTQYNQRCFTQTNQCIAGPIRTYWERNGGLAIFGYPITPQRVENVEGQPFPVQWFERDRLEDHGALGVLAGRLGARFLEQTNRPWEYFKPVAAAAANCQFFAQTHHTMCEPFLSYWRNNGGLERFGYPVTQPFGEKVEGRMFLAQYFERRRMEIHPELPGSPILLGLLGNAVQPTADAPSRFPACLDGVLPSLRPALNRLDLDAPIGCPFTPGEKLNASTQQFERGMMLWYTGARTPLPDGTVTMQPITALADTAPRFRVYPDTWQAGIDADTPNATPPAGRYNAWRGFGTVWAAHQDLRDQIGWATEQQAQPHTVDVQSFNETTQLIRVNETGVVYVLSSRDNAPYLQVLVP